MGFEAVSAFWSERLRLSYSFLHHLVLRKMTYFPNLYLLYDFLLFHQFYWFLSRVHFLFLSQHYLRSWSWEILFLLLLFRLKLFRRLTPVQDQLFASSDFAIGIENLEMFGSRYRFIDFPAVAIPFLHKSILSEFLLSQSWQMIALPPHGHFPILLHFAHLWHFQYSTAQSSKNYTLLFTFFHSNCLCRQIASGPVS